MDQILFGLQGLYMFIYLDDIIIYAISLNEHRIKFNKFAERLRKAHLKQPDKYEFLRKDPNYLDHTISGNGMKPEPEKIKAVKEFSRSRNSKNIKHILGLAEYYRCFILNFSKIAKPLPNLLKKNEKFVWFETQYEVFANLRDSVCAELLLQYTEFTKPFLITTDASGYAIGSILS